MFRRISRLAILFIGLSTAPALSAAPLQCVPYARAVSGVDLRGDAHTWWDQARERYKRGQKPRKGAVLAFRAAGAMNLGHVAVVSKVVDDRNILIRHANWSTPGAIEEDVLAVDVSDTGDWSEVRVWFSPNGQMGTRTNPTYGFIYAGKPMLRDFVPENGMEVGQRYAAAKSTPISRAAITPDAVEARPQQLAMNRPTNPQSRAVTKRSSEDRRQSRNDPFVVEYADGTSNSRSRSLADIMADVKRDAALH